MLQRDGIRIVKLEVRLLKIDQAAFHIERRAFLLFLFLEHDVVIFKNFIGLNRDIKARVTADAERHGLSIGIFNGKFRRDAAAGEVIGDRQHKIERVLLFRLLVRRKLQGNVVLSLLCDGEFLVARDAVALHLIPFAVDTCAVIAQRADDRKQNRRVAAPICFISLPNVLKAVIAHKGDELGAERINGGSFVFVFYVDQHNSSFQIAALLRPVFLHAHNLIFNQQYYNKQNRLKQERKPAIIEKTPKKSPILSVKIHQPERNLQYESSYSAYKRCRDHHKRRRDPQSRRGPRCLPLRHGR